MLVASGQQNADWSASYRVFEHERFEAKTLFAAARNTVVKQLGADDSLVVMMDDTLIRKRGRSVYGASWRRDPLGPKFQTNFVWGQRFLQISAALPESAGPSRCRGIPIDLLHCPTPRKPTKKAAQSEWIDYRQLKEKMKISVIGAARIHALRGEIDADPATMNRGLIVTIDGSFTNKAVLRKPPKNTVLIGRIRKDAKLFLPPVPAVGKKRGRSPMYGARMQTPEQIRQDDSIPWTIVNAWAAGNIHRFKIKTFEDVRWVGTGSTNARLVVIRPLAYRLRKGARIYFREPAYLLCTDPTLPLAKLLQSYAWRWEIEVNFRDQKTLLGIGEAQVRTPTAAAAVPVFMTAAYSFLLLAGSRCKMTLPRPKWQREQPNGRVSTSRLVGNLRAQLWGHGMTVNKTDFAQRSTRNTNPVLSSESLSSAVFYASR